MNEDSPSGELAIGERLMDAGDYRAALEHLQKVVDDDPSGAGHALIGLACFHLEDYPAGLRHFDAALARTPARADWQLLRRHTEANAVARIDIQAPAIAFFDKPALLERAIPTQDVILSAPARRHPLALRRFLIALGEGLGFAVSGPFHALTEVWGRVAGFHGPIWTNWYRRALPFAVLTLAYMRNELNRRNLVAVYPDDQLIGFHPRNAKPPQGVQWFRTADGSWNNLRNPLEGAAGTRFSRNVDYAAIRPESGERLLYPNPREVSRHLLTRGETMKQVPFLNLLAASWIQFQTHDWVSHGENLHDDAHEIPLAEADELRNIYRKQRLEIGRTQPDPTRRADQEPAPVTFINEVTHWWDGSQIYGSDQATVDRLRTGRDGKLRLNSNGALPVDGDGIEEAGFVRNWWVGLSLLHALFAKEHNAICDRLKTKYPHRSDEHLFNVARLINATVMAKIHTVEWTPAILPNEPANIALNANWYGLITNVLRDGKSRKTLSAVNLRNLELGGVVGNPPDNHGTPFSLTEEFVEVYRLHSLLPEALELRSHRDDAMIESVALPATRQAGSAALVARFDMADLLYSFGNQNCGALELNNYPRFLQAFSMAGSPVLDLGAIDVLRARERGVPRYNEFRRQLGLKAIGKFEHLTDDAAQVRKLRDVYGDDVEALDLLIGTLAEAPSRRPTNFGFGETLFQIFILNATRRLQTDRFYTTCYTADTYTQEGLDWIDDADFKTVLLRHHPELAETGLANIRNAFEPWDVAERLDPERHPLRAVDRELRPDPWLGERWRHG